MIKTRLAAEAEAAAARSPPQRPLKLDKMLRKPHQRLFCSGVLPPQCLCNDEHALIKA